MLSVLAFTLSEVDAGAWVHVKGVNHVFSDQCVILRLLQTWITADEDYHTSLTLYQRAGRR